MRDGAVNKGAAHATPYTLGCTKRGYASERGAMEAHRHAGCRLRAYRCPQCNRWHTANMDKGEPLGPQVGRTRQSHKRRVLTLAPELTLAQVEAIAARMRYADPVKARS